LSRPGLARNREFAALWIGQAVSNLGISISSFAYPLVVLEAGRSPAQAGLVASVLAGTAFFLRLPAGALVDRWNRRRILLVCDAGRALNSLALGVSLALGHFFLAQILAVAFVEAALGVLFGPAEAAAVRRVVRPGQIRDAVARNQSRGALPGLVGPPIGGALLAAGRALPFLADAVSYLVSLGCVLLVRTPLQDGRPVERAERRPLAELLGGLRWIWGQTFLRSLLLWFAGAGVVFTSLGLVTLVLARDRGASPAELGAMAAITASGAVAGALATPRLLRLVPPQRLAVAFAWLAAAMTLLLLPAHSPYLIGLLGAVAFLLVPPLNAVAFAYVAEHAPDRLQGRATSAGIQIASLAAPVGPLLAGLLLGGLGTTRTVVVYAGLLAVLAIVASLSRPLRLG
jgi:MFS family permease